MLKSWLLKLLHKLGDAMHLDQDSQSNQQSSKQEGGEKNEQSEQPAQQSPAAA
jgi:hypothetical protein